MIRLDRVQLLHWDMQPHQVLPLARGVTLLTGENGSGKTSILDALKVAFGATRLDGDRDIDAYLGKQAKSVVMIRVLADNRATPGTRRRPFNRIGNLTQDAVTLAVVFRAEDEGRYDRDHYILDGDVMPPLEQGRRSPAPLPSALEYRARLAKVGITPRYLKLLTLPQGQIAGLCKREPAALFEDLYDIIGGKQALEAWEKRVAEVREARRVHAGVSEELARAEDRLVALAARARRHEDWIRLTRQLADHLVALPHMERQEAQALVARVEAKVARLEKSAEEQDGKAREADERDARARADGERIREERAILKERIREADKARDLEKQAESDARSRLKECERKRAAGEGVAWEDTGSLRAEDERLRATLAAVHAARNIRAAEHERIEAGLARIAEGLLPLPVEVERFRGRLRSAGIAHHLLSEVVEVRDPAWQPAIEGYLGRFRFSILVRDLDAWGRAAELARILRYPHGILAPDVHGHSSADGESLFARLDVRDPDYRALVARLLRVVTPGEPALPLTPTRRGEQLAPDGFVVSRIEARHTHADAMFLGREALLQQERQLRTARTELETADEAADLEEGRIRTSIAEVDLRLRAQRAREEWEAVRDEYARSHAAAVQHGGEHKRLTAAIAADRAADGVLEDDARKADKRQVTASLEAKTARGEGAALRTDAERAREELVAAQADLGRLLATPLSPPSPPVDAVLAAAGSAATLRALVKDLESRERGFDVDDRDPMLPVNHRRQVADVEAVTQRLTALGESLGLTQEAAESARDEYHQATRRVFRAYFARLRQDAAELDFRVEGELLPTDNGRFRCELRVGVGEKAPVAYSSGALSGGQKAAFSILMAMTAVSLETDGAGFFLVDEPFSASDVYKINELGAFLARTGAQYLVSMPTSADVAQCGEWLDATWTCTKTRGGFDEAGRPVLAPHVKLGFAPGARDG